MKETFFLDHKDLLQAEKADSELASVNKLLVK